MCMRGTPMQRPAGHRRRLVRASWGCLMVLLLSLSILLRGQHLSLQRPSLLAAQPRPAFRSRRDSVDLARKEHTQFQGWLVLQGLRLLTPRGSAGAAPRVLPPAANPPGRCPPSEFRFGKGFRIPRCASPLRCLCPRGAPPLATFSSFKILSFSSQTASHTWNADAMRSSGPCHKHLFVCVINLFLCLFPLLVIIIRKVGAEVA
jgi:hypothetical protein